MSISDEAYGQLEAWNQDTMAWEDLVEALQRYPWAGMEKPPSDWVEVTDSLSSDHEIDDVLTLAVVRRLIDQPTARRLRSAVLGLPD